LPKNDGEQSRIRVRLTHAGYRSPNAITIFFAAKLFLGVATPMLVLTLAPFYPEFTTMQVAAAALAGALLGLFAPNAFLNRQVEKRQRNLYNGFPDALDMLVVCVEAGLGLNAAIQRVAEELTVSHPELAGELGLVNAEIRAGVDRIEALRNLAARTGLDDIRGLVALLAQSVRFGTSVADTLRVYSEEFRDKRMQRAEELAAKIGTKLIFPMVLCLFPSFFLVAIGPAIVGVLEVFKNM
jgi:tight adherence protein C